MAEGMRLEDSYRSIDGRCAVAVKNSVWVAERSGNIAVRCARTGALQSRIIDPETKIFGNSMIECFGRVWVGATNGTVRAYHAERQNVEGIVFHPQKTNGEVTVLCVTDLEVLAGMSNHDILVCCATKANLKRVISGCHAAGIVSITRSGAAIHTLDEAGSIAVWRLEGAEGMVHVGKAHRAGEYGGYSCIAASDSWSHSLWAGTKAGVIIVHDDTGNVLDITQRHHTGKVCCVMAASGKVLTGGEDKDIIVWHSDTRRVLHRLKHHSGFVSAIVPVFAMTSMRLWTMSLDKTATAWHCEGYFQSLDSLEAPQLRSALMERSSLLAATNDLQEQIDALKEERARKDRELEHAHLLVTTLQVRVSHLEQIVDGKDSTLVGSSAERKKLQDEVSDLQIRLKKSADRLAESEARISKMHAAAASLEEDLTTQKHLTNEAENNTVMIRAEKLTLDQDKHRMRGTIDNKDKEIAGLTGQLNQLREDVIQRKLAYDRLLHQGEIDKREKEAAEKSYMHLQSENKGLHESVKRLSDLLLLKDNELKEKGMELTNVSVQFSARQLEYETVVHQREALLEQMKQLQDQYVIRTHEMETLRKELENSQKVNVTLRKDVTELTSTEGKLRWQMEQLRKDLETERNNTRLLQDQYTIFQFVVNSRGELVNSLWKLYQTVTACNKSLKEVGQNIDKIGASIPVPKKEWKETVITKMSAATAFIKEVEEKATYIISNYFSEYEKLHLGISSYYFHPDTTRAPVVGEELLMKLREVTPLKHVADINGATITSNKSGSGNSGLVTPVTGLPPPVQSSTTGPSHAVSGMASPPRSRPRKFT